jgi:hypothetical protein
MRGSGMSFDRVVDEPFAWVLPLPAMQMRRVALACLLLPVVVACKSSKGAGDGGADAEPDVVLGDLPGDNTASDAGDTDGPAAPAHNVPVRACTNGQTMCAPGGFEEMVCTNGAWKMAQTCRGPGGCKSDATGVHCDVGNPVAGDACTAGAPARCVGATTVLACQNGHWASSVCMPPAKCNATAKGPAGAGCVR